MALRSEEEYVLVKLNTGAYGLDQALLAADALPVFDVQYSPEYSKTTMKEARGFPGGSAEKITGGFQKLTFKAYVRGSTAKDVPAINGKLLRLCGNSETITATTSVTYAPATDTFEHGTIYYYVGGASGVLHKLTGVRGSVKLVTKVGDLDYYEFEFLGLDNGPVAAGALPAVSWVGLSIPMHTAANTVETMTLFGQAVGMANMTVTFGNKFSHMHVTGEEEIAFESREGTVDISIVEPNPTTINWWTKARAGDQGALVYQRGKTADVANILLLNVANLQLGGVSRRKEAGKLYLDIKMSIVPTAKNGDYTLITK
ncbi:MAG: hypothetical protein U5L01_11415 [Rheinheimera sp.]|nr:hypothetical protein [Rheinheimera sp.]